MIDRLISGLRGSVLHLGDLGLDAVDGGIRPLLGPQDAGFSQGIGGVQDRRF